MFLRGVRHFLLNGKGGGVYLIVGVKITWEASLI